MKRKINIFIFLLLSISTYAHIGIATIKNASCQGVADGSVGFYLYGNAGPFSYQIIDDAGKVIAGNFVKGDDENLITVGKLDKRKYKLVVTNSKINTKCEVTKEFEIKCCPPDLQDIAIVLDSKGFDPVTGGFINTIVKTKAQGPFYYNWNSPSGGHYSTENLSDLKESGQYCVTVTNGCESAEACFDLSECGDKSSIVIDGIVTPTSSIGGGDGAIDITVTGGSAPYEITWWDDKGNIILTQSGAKDLDLVDIVAGTYKVKVSDGTECTITTFVVYDCDLLAITPKATIVKPSTLTSNDGSITLTLSASSNPKVTYFWQGKSTGFTSTDKNISNLAPDMYCLIVKDENCGLVYEECYDLLSKCGLYLDTKVLPYCTYGVIDITPVNGTAPYTYQWTQGSGNSGNYATVGAGNHVVKVTDSKGCFVYGNYNIVFQTLNIVPNVTNLDCDKLGEIELTTTGGLQPYTYKWSNGVNGVGLNKISNLPTGTYSVEVSSANGCKTVKNFSITFPDNAYGVKIVQPKCLVEGLTNSVFVDASYNGNSNCSDCTYLWDDGNTLKIRTFTKPGTYTVKVKNPQGCEGTATYNVMLAVFFADCSPASVPIGNGMIGLLLPPGFNVKWKNPVSFATNLGGLKSGDYEATISFSDVCTITKVFTLPKASFAGFTTTALNCKDRETEIATWGESVVYPIKAFANGTQVNIANTPSDKLIIKSKYSSENITFTDARGCSFTKSVSFEDKSLKAELLAQQTKCEGDDMELRLSITGYYAKNPPFECELFYNGVSVGGKVTVNSSYELIKTVGITSSGTYSVVVKKDLGNGIFCTTDAKITPDFSLKPLATFATGDACNETKNNGVIKLISAVSGNTYKWSNGSVNSTQNNLTEGTYTVVINNTNGCSSTKIYEIKDALLASTVTITNECPGRKDGKIEVAFSGVTPVFLWSNSVSTPNNYNLQKGTYELTITDGNRCKILRYFQIEEAECGKPKPEYICPPCGDEICNGKPIIPQKLTNNATISKIVNANGTTSGSVSIVTMATGATFVVKNSSNVTVATGTLSTPETNIPNLAAGKFTIEISNLSANCPKKTIPFTIDVCDGYWKDVVTSEITPFYSSTKMGAIAITNTDLGDKYFNWTGPNGFTSHNQNLTKLPAGTYTVTISPYCDKPLVKTFVVVDIKECKKPSVKISSINACDCPTCPKGNISASLSNSNNYSFYWYPTGTTGMSINEASPGKYRLKVVELKTGCDFYYDGEVFKSEFTSASVPNSCDIEYQCNKKKYIVLVQPTELKKLGKLCDIEYTCPDNTKFTKDEFKYDYQYLNGFSTGLPPIKTNGKICQAQKLCKNKDADFVDGKWVSTPDPDNCRVKWECVLNKKIPSLAPLEGYVYDSNVKKCSKIVPGNARLLDDDLSVCHCEDYYSCGNKLLEQVTDNIDIEGKCTDFSIGKIACNYEACPATILSPPGSSKVAKIQDNIIFTIVPNPTIDKFSIIFDSIEETQAILELQTVEGRLIDKQAISLYKGKNSQEIDLENFRLYHGIIFVKLKLASGNSYIQKVIKL